MNSGIVYVYHNDPYNLIDEPEYFFQYRFWRISDHEVTIIQTSITQISNAQLYVVSKSHVFTDITTFAYIRPVKRSVQIINARKYPAKGFELVIIKTPNKNIIIPLLPSCSMPQNPQNTIIQTELKH